MDRDHIGKSKEREIVRGGEDKEEEETNEDRLRWWRGVVRWICRMQ